MMTTSDLMLFLGQFIGPIGGVSAVVMLLKLRGEKSKLNAETRKASADATEVITGTAVSLLEPLRQQVVSLSSQLATTETQLARTQAELETARQETRSLRVQMAEMSQELAELRGRQNST